MTAKHGGSAIHFSDDLSVGANCDLGFEANDFCSEYYTAKVLNEH